MRLSPALAALVLTGCILDTETCGHGFVAEGDRCVPARPPPPFGGRSDDAAPAKPDDAAPSTRDWAAFTGVEIRDLTTLREASQEPDAPGADIDAVAVEALDGFVGSGAQVVDAFVGDPSGRSSATDPRQALGPPDAQLREERYVSLGADGGRLLLRLGLNRPLAAGDQLVVHEVRHRGGADDRFAVSLCVLPEEGHTPVRCEAVGDGSGTTAFRLP